MFYVLYKDNRQDTPACTARPPTLQRPAHTNFLYHRWILERQITWNDWNAISAILNATEMVERMVADAGTCVKKTSKEHTQSRMKGLNNQRDGIISDKATVCFRRLNFSNPKFEFHCPRKLIFQPCMEYREISEVS